ncbi:MAG: hypothetical protein Q8830_02970 [Candidatus Phytoplasma australasiaticum]|nr:hypothetical protein [Candidatus Phytoplasma australasiaticum]
MNTKIVFQEYIQLFNIQTGDIPFLFFIFYLFCCQKQQQDFIIISTTYSY